ncbi:hypothetical protein LCGC14_1870110 [marine sediment metagenome]|uniref:Uncharacterized protein n=1 Tax=marine sediment metagenome TaxID=412755 RepID=A0A0F9G5B6_9ZZZZ
MIYLGDFAEDETVYIPFNTFDADGASVTVTDLAATDVHIHKDGGLTQRNNAAGITVSINYDGITGNHLLAIDTSDDTVAGFWVTGSDYQVRLEGITVATKTLNVWIGVFSIENRSVLVSAGALEITYTVKEDDEDTGDPIDGVEVWITTDSAGTNVIWSGTTDTNGVLKESGDSKPFLDAGTYYFWRKKAGYSFTNPDTETFS